MHPVLVDLGFVTIGTYGFLLAVAFVAAVWLAMVRARREGISPQHILDLSCYVLISAILGAKLLLVIVDWREYLAHPERLTQVLRLGGVYYGGFILALLVGLWFMRRKGLETWHVADVLAPSIALGQAIGRLGCFMAGCCHGKVCHQPWAVTFSDPEAHRNVGVPLGVPLHPTQLYSSFNALIIFAILTWLSRRKSFNGQVFWTYVGLYSVTRAVIEFFRGDHRGALFGGTISTAQFIGFLLLPVSVFFYRMLRRRSEAG